MEILNVLILLGIIIIMIFSFLIGKFFGKRYMKDFIDELVKSERKKAIEKSRAILKGQFSEQLSPFDSDFPTKPSEARFLGAPIDFIAFRGLDEKNVEEIVFIEVKTGQANLNNTEKSIKEAIENKRVKFETYRI